MGRKQHVMKDSYTRYRYSRYDTRQGINESKVATTEKCGVEIRRAGLAGAAARREAATRHGARVSLPLHMQEMGRQTFAETRSSSMY
jgi:hypothetical protein